MTRLPIALTICIVFAHVAMAGAAETITKRIRTSHTQVVQHIRDTPGFRGSEDAPASSLTVGACRGYHFNRAHKAKTWRCTYRYVIAGYRCTGTYHGGYVRFRLQDGRTGTGWHDDAPEKSCAQP